MASPPSTPVSQLCTEHVQYVQLRTHPVPHMYVQYRSKNLHRHVGDQQMQYLSSLLRMSPDGWRIQPGWSRRTGAFGGPPSLSYLPAPFWIS